MLRRPALSLHAHRRPAGAAAAAALLAAGLTASMVGQAVAAPGAPSAPSASPTATASPTASASPTRPSTATASPSPTRAPSTSASPSPTPTPTPTPTRLPKPRTLVTAQLTWPSGVPGAPGDGTSIGVGILPVLRFSADVTERQLVVDRTSVTARKASVRGAWRWTDARTAVFRPKRFWPGNAKIRIAVDLAGQTLGMDGRRYLVGDPSLTTTYSFTTARSWIARVNAKTAHMTVKIDGQAVEEFGVSLGKPGWESRSGLKVYYGVKEATHTYTSESLGLEDEQYELVAPWNVRLTPTGEFIHTAQWAYDRIGRYNGSHGCTNMFESDAKWIYDRVVVGDVFKYTGTSKPMETTNGPLALWNIRWAEWKALAEQSLTD